MPAARGARSSRHGSLPARRVSRTWSSQNIVSNAWAVSALQFQHAPLRDAIASAAIPRRAAFWRAFAGLAIYCG
eukprot:NODE_16430_length_995_cov_5.814516.p5 GENE.NODE_16430_length_995_cov_5.814516~~NODE_16430_length_995_cov_5.814516.p5  ORF type:complete len:74 (+),score=16.47 NODE_16430_length_995_cov_5.814516:629-850(+)